jgi:predicted RNase H-like HicB family nuclease
MTHDRVEIFIGYRGDLRPKLFGFFSPELEGFTGTGQSIEDCLYKARWGMEEHVSLLRERNLPVTAANCMPTVTIQNEMEKVS